MTPHSLRRRLARVAGWAFALLVVFGMSLARCDLPRDELVRKYGASPSRFLDIEGMQVHYRDEGSGPPLVLLHGTSSSLHTWDGWVARLATHRRIVRLDLPGFGLTGPAPDRDYRASRLARVVVALMDHLQIERADVAGNSLGGRVALTLALEAPARVRRLVLVDAAGLSGQQPPPIVALAQIPVLNRLLSVVTPRLLVRKNVEDAYAERARVTEELVDRYYELTRREGNRAALVDRLTTRAHDPDLDARLADVRAPVLLEWGERDRWIPLSFAERYRSAIAGAKLVTYPDAGHVPMEETPEATARDADAFLAE